VTEKSMQWLALVLYVGTAAGLSCGLALLLYKKWALGASVLVVAVAAAIGLVALGRYRRGTAP
jgi:hypothetical protein